MKNCQRTRDLVSSFEDYRPYTPGDDLRSIDWNIYRRLGRVFIRLFEEQQDLPLYLMPDLSESMFLEDPPRAKAGFQSAMALATISMNHHDSAGLFPFGDKLQVVLKNKSGKANIMAFAKHLSMLKPEKHTYLELALNKLTSMNLRPGLLAIISDFFAPEGLDALRKSLRSVRHKLLLFNLPRRRMQIRSWKVSYDSKIVKPGKRQISRSRRRC